MSPDSVSYVQKIVGIKAVTMHGKVEMYDPNPRDPDSYAYWRVGTDRIDEWLEKFEGKTVYLEIKTYLEDESHLLPESERGPKP